MAAKNIRTDSEKSADLVADSESVNRNNTKINQLLNIYTVSIDQLICSQH